MQHFLPHFKCFAVKFESANLCQSVHLCLSVCLSMSFCMEAVCLQNVAVTLPVLRRCRAIHWVAVAHTLTANSVCVRPVWLGVSVTPVNLATGTYDDTTLMDVKVFDLHCSSSSSSHLVVATLRHSLQWV